MYWKSKVARKILHINMYPNNTNIDARSRSKGVKNPNNRQNWTHLISNDSKFFP